LPVPVRVKSHRAQAWMRGDRPNFAIASHFSFPGN
jgi:hypothetical protein